jgi:Ger(x)C family germination protein
VNSRTFLKVIPFLCLLLVTSGCAIDARELDYRSMILGMAVDKAEEEDKMLVSLQLPVLGGGIDISPRQKDSEVISSADKTIFDAIAHFEMVSPRVLFFGHLKVVAISEDVARDGISSIVDFLGRQVQIGNRVLLIIVEGQAKEFISTNSPLISLPSLYIDTFFRAEQKVARTTDSPVFEYLRDIHSITETAFIPLGRITEGGEIKIQDVVVMKQHKMIDVIRDHSVTNAILLKKRKIDNMKTTVTLRADNKEVKVTLAPVKLKMNIDFKKTNPVEFNFRVKGTAEVHGKTEMEITASLDFLNKIEDQLNQDIEKDLLKTISDMKKINVEPFLFGQYLFALDTKYYDTLDWNDTGWKEAKFNISVDTKITSTGMRGTHDKKKVGR